MRQQGGAWVLHSTPRGTQERIWQQTMSTCLCCAPCRAVLRHVSCRTIMAEHFGALSLPVGEFLALEHGTEFQGYSRIQESEVTQSKGHK